MAGEPSNPEDYDPIVSQRRFRLFILVAVAFSIALRWLVQPSPNFGATHDDELMVRMAANILRGNWVGDYSEFGHLLLSKPAGYPLFLAWTHVLPWAPTVTVHLVLVVGVLVCAREFRLMGMSRSVNLVFVTLSLFFPQWFGYQMSRIYRDGLLAALTFLGIGLALALGRSAKQMFDATELPKSVGFRTLALGILVGVCLSWHIITKPSWYPLALTVAAITCRSITTRTIRAWRVFVPRAILLGFVILLSAYSMPRYVEHQNEKHFGVSVVDSFSSGSFPAAYQAWTSVRAGPPRKYVLVSEAQRDAVYAVSATAKKLRPFLELPWGNGWRGSACGSPLKICDESATWFVWDLRDAMRSAGLDTDAGTFERSFSELNREIRSACSSGRLHCRSGGLAPGVRPLSLISKREVIEAFSTSLDWLVFPDVGSTVRSGEIPKDNQHATDWALAAKDLPPNSPSEAYRPEVSSLGSTINLLDRIYATIWPLMLLGSAAVFVSQFRIRSFQSEWFKVSAALLFGGSLLIAQLALLEASSGMYLSTGKYLYLLSLFPYALCLVGLTADQVCKQATKCFCA